MGPATKQEVDLETGFAALRESTPPALTREDNAPPMGPMAGALASLDRSIRLQAGAPGPPVGEFTARCKVLGGARRKIEVFRDGCPEDLREAFLDLRNTLIWEKEWRREAHQPLTSVAVLSPSRGCGRSFTALNLAACLGVDPQNPVLLVEADWARPALDQVLSIPGTPGLREALQVSQWGRFLHQLDGMGLYVLPAGAGADLDSPDSTQLKSWLQEAARMFHWVIVDGPGFDCAYAQVLARLCDGTILVASEDQTGFDETAYVLDRIDRSRMIGAVLNRSRR